MKIIEVTPLSFPEIKVIQFARFSDHRGYFTEPFRKSDLLNHPQLEELKEVEFVQTNESFSKSRTIRGLHFQWNPYMGKLVRTLYGRMVDLILDIRLGSPTFGKIIAYDMPYQEESDTSEWIWVPPGFAHGNFFPQESLIEYFCTGEYSPTSEAGISPFAADIDWSLCESHLKSEFDRLRTSTCVSDKDKGGFSLNEWTEDRRSENFKSAVLNA